jgi:hypothetical protein
MDELPRRHEEIAAVLDAVTAAGRAEYEQWGPYSPDANEKNRRSGITLAAWWLLDPRETVGPLADGPATSIDRVRWQAALGRRLIPDGVDPYGRYAPVSAPGFRQRWQAEVLGIVQMLTWALGDTDEIPGFVESRSDRRAA